MAKLEICIHFPGGNIPEMSDPQGLIDYITSELKAMHTKFPDIKINAPTKTTAKGAAGFPEMIQWTGEFYCQYQNEILTVLGSMIIPGISIAIKNFLKQIKKPKKPANKRNHEDESAAPCITMTITDVNNKVTLNLPSDNKTIAEWIEKAKEITSAERTN